MKHFLKKHTSHFGLWAVSGIILMISIFWISAVNKQAPVAYKDFPVVLKSPLQEKKLNVAFKIVFPTETREFNVHTKEGATVYDAMLELDKENNLDIKFKEFSGLGAMLQSINGVANDALANRFWIYYINGAPAHVGVSSAKIINDDKITWNYETSKN